MVTDEFKKIHQVIRLHLVGIGLVGMMDVCQGKGHFSDDVPEVERDVGITQPGFIEPLVKIQVQVLIVVLPPEQTFHAGSPAKIDDRIFIDNRNAIELPDVELFVWSPADFPGEFSSRHLLDRIPRIAFYIGNGTSRRLLPPPETEVIGQVILELLHVLHTEVIVVDPFVVVASFERQQEVIFLYELQTLTRDLGFLLVGDPDIVLRKAIYGLIVERIGSAEKVLPFLIFKTISGICLGIKPGAEMRSGPAAKT